MADIQLDILTALVSIDTTLKHLLALSTHRAAAKGSTGGTIADDRDLDGKYGDPELKYLPRDWTGDPSFKGLRFSECPPELLDMVAESCEYSARKAAEKNEMTAKGKPVADYRRQDAARARGWAKRMRDGKHVLPSNANGSHPSDSGWASDSSGY